MNKKIIMEKEILNNSQLIIGIDPGIRNTGWGIVRLFENRFSHVDHGVIIPSTIDNDPVRLNFISLELNSVLKKYKPTSASIEKIFVHASGESALKLGMARGVALQVLASAKLSIIELAARLIKKSLTGSGSADKIQVKFMVENILNVSVDKLDASDALAIAIAGLNNGLSKSNNNLPGNKLDLAIQRALIKE